MNEDTTIQTVKEVRDQQTLWVDWMEKAVEGLSDDALVSVTRKYAGMFGSYVIAIEPVK